MLLACTVKHVLAAYIKKDEVMYIQVQNKPKTANSKSFSEQLIYTQNVSINRVVLWRIVHLYTYLCYVMLYMPSLILVIG